MNSAHGCVLMAVTIATVIGNVCLSRCRKDDLEFFRSGIQTLATLTHHGAQKPDWTPAFQFVYSLWITDAEIQNAITTKPHVKMNRMTHQQKAKFVGDIFYMRCFCGGHGEILPRTVLYRKVWSARKAVLPTGRVSDRRNSQIANRLDPCNRSLESLESFIPKRYSRLPDFQPIQNSIAYKPFSGQSRMSNG
jgi:hypothetical protein